jgi:predicted flavoprotein YhiN
MCAIEAGKRGRRVAVLERAGRIGKKILISGGGRCNFTNLYCQPENFISANPHFAKSALAAYTPAAFIRLVEKDGIRYREKALGQLFCDGSAQQIVTMLESGCRAGVRILTNVNVKQKSARASGCSGPQAGLSSSSWTEHVGWDEHGLAVQWWMAGIPHLGANASSAPLAEREESRGPCADRFQQHIFR